MDRDTITKLFQEIVAIQIELGGLEKKLSALTLPLIEADKNIVKAKEAESEVKKRFEASQESLLVAKDNLAKKQEAIKVAEAIAAQATENVKAIEAVIRAEYAPSIFQSLQVDIDSAVDARNELKAKVDELAAKVQKTRAELQAKKAQLAEEGLEINFGTAGKTTYL